MKVIWLYNPFDWSQSTTQSREVLKSHSGFFNISYFCFEVVLFLSLLSFIRFIHNITSEKYELEFICFRNNRTSEIYELTNELILLFASYKPTELKFCLSTNQLCSHIIYAIIFTTSLCLQLHWLWTFTDVSKFDCYSWDSHDMLRAVYLALFHCSVFQDIPIWGIANKQRLTCMHYWQVDCW